MTQTKSLSSTFTAGYIFALALPIMAELFLGVLIGFADTVMVSSCGQSAVSAVSLIDSLSQLVIQVLSAFASAGSIVCAQYIGSGDQKKASQAAKQLLYSSFLISATLVCICIGLRGPIIDSVFGSIEADVRANCSTYFIWIFLSYPFLAVFNSAAATLRAVGDSRLQLKVSCLTNILNIGFNALFIYVFNMGVAGAAISSLISRFVGMLIMLLCLRSGSHGIGIGKIFKLDWGPSQIKRIVKIAIPSSIEASFFHVGKISVQSLVSILGTSSIAANAAANSLSSIACVPGSAIALTAISIIGRLCGARETETVKKLSLKLFCIGQSVMICVSLLVYFFRLPLIGFFAISDEAHAIALKIMNLYVWAQISFWCLAFITPNFLKAAGDVKYLMGVAVCSMWFARVFCSRLFVLKFGLGVQGVWMGMYLDWIVRALFFSLRFMGKRWLNKRVI